MNKKLIIVLIISLAIAGLVYMFVKEKKKKQSLGGGATNPLQNGNSGGIVPANNTGIPPLATQTIYPASPVLQGSPVANNTPTSFPIGVGSTGILVKMIQASLGLKVDGVYGQNTDMAVKMAKIDLGSAQKFTDTFISVDGSQYKKYFPLKKGSKNNYVKAVQIFLGIKPDGVFGAGTEKALIASTGKNVLYHADFTAMYTVATGNKINYNGKDVSSTTLGNLSTGMLGWLRTLAPTAP